MYGVWTNDPGRSMKIVSAQVNWDLGTRPVLGIIVDKIPNPEDLRYVRSNHLWYAELDGYVSFFSWREKEGDNGGFGSNKYDITMVDGRKKTLIGPWSSRAGAMNQCGFGPCVDVDLYEEGTPWLVGRAVSLAFASEAIAQCPLPYAEILAYKRFNPPKIGDIMGVVLSLRPHHDEPVWDPALVLRDGHYWHKP